MPPFPRCRQLSTVSTVKCSAVSWAPCGRCTSQTRPSSRRCSDNRASSPSGPLSNRGRCTEMTEAYPWACLQRKALFVDADN